MSVLPAISTPYIHSTIKRRKNTWYSIADGNWSNRNIWMSNSLRKYNYPQAGDDVYVNHNVTGDISSSINNLRIAGKLTFANSVSIKVNGDLQAVGTVDMSGINSKLYLRGWINVVSNFVAGSSSTVTYDGNLSQMIDNLNYNHLTTDGGGTKYFSGNISIAGNFRVQAETDIASYDLIVSGITYVFNILYKSGPGNVTFVDKLQINNARIPRVDFRAGNPNVECRNGISFESNYGQNLWSGTGTWNFTTNNQSLTCGVAGMLIFDTTVNIDNITLTVNTGFAPLSYSPYVRFSVITGSGILKNSGFIIFSSATISPTLDIFYTGTAIGYAMASEFTLPATNYYSLYIEGNAKLSGDTIVADYLFCYGNLKCENYDIEIGNACLIGYGSFNSCLSKTDAGNVTFGGSVKIIAGSYIDFSGNPNVECKNGITTSPNASILGTGTWNFTTNNQTVSIYGDSIVNMLITSIEVTFLQIVTGNITNLNGADSVSKFINKYSGYTGSCVYLGANIPMATGILDCSSNVNTFGYLADGDQEVKGGTYKTLELGGSGAKKLMGNVVVQTAYSLTGTATVDLNGFTLTHP